MAAQIFVGTFSHALNVYSTSGVPMNSFSTAGVVGCLTMDDNRNLFVGNFIGRVGGSDAVGQYDLSGNPVTASLISNLRLGFSSLLAVGTNLFVINDGNIAQYSTDGILLNPSLVFSGAGSIAYDGAGHLFVARPSDNAIGEYGVDGTVIKDPLITGLHGTNGSPFGLAADGNGHLFVASPGDGTIAEYATTGSLINASLVSGLSYPVALALDDSANLFVVNSFSGTVGEYTSSGATVNASLISGLAAPTCILVVPPTNSQPRFTVFGSMGNGVFQFSIAGGPGSNFSVLGSTNLGVPESNWTALNMVTQASPGMFQFTDLATSNSPEKFYRLRWP